METINLTVSGMTCGACVKHVEKAINSVAGVQRVEIDLETGAVKVYGDVSQHVKEMIAALENDGYPAKLNLEGVSQASAKKGSCKSGTSCCCN